MANGVNDSGNSVRKYKNFLLETFSSIGKLPDVAKEKNA
jgi:hypothetical protein